MKISEWIFEQGTLIRSEPPRRLGVFMGVFQKPDFIYYRYFSYISRQCAARLGHAYKIIETKGIYGAPLFQHHDDELGSCVISV